MVMWLEHSVGKRVSIIFGELEWRGKGSFDEGKGMNEAHNQGQWGESGPDGNLHFTSEQVGKPMESLSSAF